MSEPQKNQSEYAPTISIPLNEAVKAWISGMRWPNGDKIDVNEFRCYVSASHDEITIMPRCVPATPAQLIPKS